MNVLKQKGGRLFLLVLLALICAFAGQKTVMAASVSGKTDVYIGKKITLTAADFPEGAEITWTSSDEGIVSVGTGKGSSVKAEAVGFGKATVTASAVDAEQTVTTAEIQINTKLATPKLGGLVVVGAKTLKVKWKAVSGAEGYIIYRKTGKGTWKMLETLKDAGAVSYTDTTCELGNTYTYTVRAYAYNQTAKMDQKGSYDETGVKGKTKLSAPELKSATVTSSTSIKVKWKAVTDADSYVLYRKVKGSSKWERVGTTTKTTLSDKKTACGTTYTYTVRAVCGTTKSSYDKTGITCQSTLPQPDLVSLTTKGKKKLLLTWDSVEGADGYRVYRKSSAGKWKMLSTVKEGTTYLDTVKYKTDYTYTVKAYAKVNKKVVWGLYDKTGITGRTRSKSEVKQSLEAPKLVGAVGSSYCSITVSWEAVSGVDGYSVYRLTDKNTWARVADVEGAGTLSYEDKTCTFGTKYTYTVISYVNYDGEPLRGDDWDDDGVSAKPVLAAPELKKASVTGLKQIKVTWGSVEGADGYTIYRKTADSKWIKLKNVTGTSYTDTTIENNVTYYYTVRAYVKVTKDGKTTGERGKYDKDGISAQAKITSKYKNGLKLYYDSNGNLIKDVESIIGKQDSYLLKVNKQRNTVTVYAKDDNGEYVVPVKAFICSTGSATPVGTFKTPAKYRWHELMGPCWSQWCTRIHGGVLFHSVYYMTYNDKTDLSVKAYNKLGTQCSHGCVRLTAGDAKWIYDNCKLGTTVTVYNSSNAGPFGKPSAYTLAKNHRWDPTDPTVQYLCKKNGCHNYKK